MHITHMYSLPAYRACRQLVCAAQQLLALLEQSVLQLQRWVGLQEARDACAAVESRARAAVAVARAAGLVGCLAGATRALFASGLSSLAPACAPPAKPPLLNLGGLLGRARAASLLLAAGGGRVPSSAGAAAWAPWAAASLCYCRAAACFVLGWVLAAVLLAAALRGLSHARTLQLPSSPPSSSSSAGHGALQLLQFPVTADPQPRAREAQARCCCSHSSSMPSCGGGAHHNHARACAGCSVCASLRPSCSGRGAAPPSPSHANQHYCALGPSLPSTALHVVQLSMGGIGALSAPATWLLGGSLAAWLAGQLAWACLLAAHLCHAWPTTTSTGSSCAATASSSGGGAGKASAGEYGRLLRGNAAVPAVQLAAQLASTLLLPFLLGALPFAGGALRAAAALARLLAVAAAAAIVGPAALRYLRLRGGVEVGR
jgi:hypothetical protein